MPPLIWVCALQVIQNSARGNLHRSYLVSLLLERSMPARCRRWQAHWHIFPDAGETWTFHSSEQGLLLRAGPLLPTEIPRQ